jgi:hypothetical protein
LFTPGGTIPMEYLERDRIGARIVEGFAAIGRVVLFDRRGIGQSDPINDWSRPLVEQWADDLWTVVTAVCATAPVVVTSETIGDRPACSPRSIRTRCHRWSSTNRPVRSQPWTCR